MARCWSKWTVWTLAFAAVAVSCGQSHAAKRVILMVGDGMGFKHVEMTRNYLGGPLVMEQLPVKFAVSTCEHGGSYDPAQAWSSFSYVNGGATDSASAATSLSTGYKANDGNIATDNGDVNRLLTLTEYARMNDASAGVVSSVPFSHATPASFASHNNSRNNYTAIAREMITSIGDGTGARGNTPTVNLVIGGGHPSWQSSYISTTEYAALANGTTGQGWTFVQRQSGIDGTASLANATSSNKLFGLFGGSGGNLEYRLANGSGANAENPTLAEMAVAAVTVLDRDPDGFFLLIEGGAIDWASHSNNANQMIGETIGFDEAVAAVVDWVDTVDPTWSETLLVVTADHETGYITRASGQFASVALANPGAGIVPTAGGTHFAWNSTGHSNSLVPLFARGAGSEVLAEYATKADPVRGAYLDNTQVANALQRAVADEFHFTVTSGARGYATEFDSVLLGMMARVGGIGAFHVLAGDIDPPASIRGRIDAQFGAHAVWYPIVGNYEADTAVDMAWLHAEYTTGNGRVPLRTFTKRDGPVGSVETTWTWEYGNACFIGLNEYWNGATTAGSDAATDGNVVSGLRDWLRARLAQTDKPVIFVIGHEPAYPQNGEIGTSLDKYPDQRDEFWYVLESDPRVKAYICGHTHRFSAYRQPGGRVWQVDVGNAGDDAWADGFTFLDVTVNQEQVRLDAWRENNTGVFSLAGTWQMPSQVAPLDVQHPAAAKQLAEFSYVRLNAVVTAAFENFLYVEDTDRVSGIRVNSPGHAQAVNRMVTVTGTTVTSSDGERCIQATSLSSGEAVAVEPLGMTHKSAGGSGWHYDPQARTGQQGIAGASGLTNLGLLVRLAGRVTYKGADHFYVDDGSGVSDGSGHLGVKVLPYDYPVPDEAAFVEFTGINACYRSGDSVHRLVHAVEGLPRHAFTAYNDVVWSSPQPAPLPNVTTVCIGSGSPGPSTAILKDFYTGASTGVTAALTQGGGVNYQPSLDTGGSECNPGTDAYNLFTSKGVRVAGVVYYGSTGWYVDLALTGLDPTKHYEFATTANRNGSSYADRISQFTLVGADTYTNISTSGGSGASTIMNTGYNTVNGHVARWTDIDPGDDGAILIRANAGTTQNSAYAFSVFLLKQID